ncbi:MAG: TRAP transporter small permease [Christensenellales bacterium]|jgi:TRAP-type C4-dicarboxylate transport system permease small subunit
MIEKENNKLFNTALAINNILLKIEELVLGGFTLALVVAIFIEVICRYVLFISTAWAEEIARYLFIWMTFIGSAYAFNYSTHIEIDILPQVVEKLKCIKNKAKAKRIIDLAAIVSTMIFLIVFCFIFNNYLRIIFKTNQTSPTMRIPMGLVYLPVLIGCIITIYHGFFQVILVFLDIRRSQK